MKTCWMYKNNLFTNWGKYKVSWNFGVYYKFLKLHPQIIWHSYFPLHRISWRKGSECSGAKWVKGWMCIFCSFDLWITGVFAVWMPESSQCYIHDLFTFSALRCQKHTPRRGHTARTRFWRCTSRCRRCPSVTRRRPRPWWGPPSSSSSAASTTKSMQWVVWSFQAPAEILSPFLLGVLLLLCCCWWWAFCLGLRGRGVDTCTWIALIWS